MKLHIVKHLIMILAVAALTSTVYARSIDEGIEYKTITPAVPTDTDKKVEVVELFWYMCGHCYHAEPHVNAFKKNLPKNVEFKRIPAIFNQQWVFHARVYYTAVALDVVDKIHTPLFDAIHKHKKKIVTVDQMAQFFKQHAGTDPAQFKAMYESFGVDALVRRSIDLSKRYQADGVPTMIINGKYRTDGKLGGTTAGAHKGMMEVVRHVVDKELEKK